MVESTRQSVLFARGQFSKPTTVVFDAENQSSDAGLLLLAAVDKRFGLTERLAGCLVDRRDRRKVDHSFLEMIQQRVFGIAAGYADCNDAARTANDPILKEASGRRALADGALASQPTLSRFENAVGRREVLAALRALEETVIERHARRRSRRTKLITLDFDSTEDPTYGQQRFTFFNGYYDSWCYLPLLGFVSFDDEPDQYLFHARLRPGNARDYRTLYPTLRRTVAKLREEFPRARIRVRLDAGFARPETFELLEELKVEYVVAMPGNKRINELAEPLLAEARLQFEKLQETVQIFGAVEYAADSWNKPRRVVVKAEILEGVDEPKENPRFVVTNIRGNAKRLYTEVYCSRGNGENRIKELKQLDVDRTSCNRFVPNQLRVLFSAVAFVLFQELRLRARGTALERAQVPTLRERLVKVAARVVESVRRLVVHLPASYPWARLWARLAGSVAR
jgi:hypothetical protein